MVGETDAKLMESSNCSNLKSSSTFRKYTPPSFCLMFTPLFLFRRKEVDLRGSTAKATGFSSIRSSGTVMPNAVGH